MILLFFVFLTTTLSAQTYQLSYLTDLSEDVYESSGLLYRDGRLITHNDSGDGPWLYEIDTLNGEINRSVYIEQATHVDWEDITADEDYLYIGDIGNNLGSRTNLRIYRLSWPEYLMSDTVTAEVIDYAYADQVDFSDSQFTTPYDAEALVAIGDSLYLFTKDWSALRSKVYPLPKIPGAYSVTAIDSFAVMGLLTGVDRSPTSDRLLFSSYSPTEGFVTTISDFTPPFFSQGVISHWSAPFSASIKTEGICWRDQRFAFVSTETLLGQPADLHRLDTDFTDDIEEIDAREKIQVFPQPANDYLRVSGVEVEALALYDMTGNLLVTVRTTVLDTSGLPDGIYLLNVRTSEGTFSRNVIIQ